ncbi:hypothetical protein [Acinetobacter populi]|uniref:Uncharacterized protein n=1 Tax=Acinetobacter populi TaxID=1582270 RepID=A0A1Z9YZC8_9GAMM|nr:hypothetical protein [Acinetobacter populi]OUY07568.1 hypothetical protein CAP51_07410 [Acinetobacter populi]
MQIVLINYDQQYLAFDPITCDSDLYTHCRVENNHTFSMAIDVYLFPAEIEQVITQLKLLRQYSDDQIKLNALTQDDLELVFYSRMEAFMIDVKMRKQSFINNHIVVTEFKTTFSLPFDLISLVIEKLRELDSFIRNYS